MIEGQSKINKRGLAITIILVALTVIADIVLWNVESKETGLIIETLIVLSVAALYYGEAFVNDRKRVKS